MKPKLKILPAVIIAGFLALAGFYGIGAAGRTSGGKDANWSRQAEEAFYLSPGMAEKILSRNQWRMFQKEMKDMAPDQLSSFRLGMHKILMQDTHARHFDVPAESHYDESQLDVKLNTDDDPAIRLVAGAAAGSARGGVSISAGAATGLGGSTPATGTSGTASGSLGGTASLGGGSTPVTGTAGTASGSRGGTSSLGAFGQSATGDLTSTPVTGTSGSLGTASFGDFNVQAAPNLTSVPVTGSSGTAGGATGFESDTSPVTGTSGVLSGTTGATAALTSFNPVADFNAASSLTGVAPSGAPVITITPNQSDISPVVAAMGLAGREPTYDVCIQGSVTGPYAPVPAASVPQPSSMSVSNGFVTSADAGRMFGSDPTTSTRRSVGSYDDSRGAIFHRDFDIGGGRPDRDRNYW